MNCLIIRFLPQVRVTLVLVCLTLTSGVIANRLADAQDSDPDTRLSPRTLRGRFFLGPSVYERSHSSVKKAFRTVVADARRSTVRLVSDGRTIALGTIVDRNGYIVTKESELLGEVEVHLADGQRLAAKVVGVVPEHDLAMLKVNAIGLHPVKWRKTGPPEVGSWLATCGPADSSADPLAVGVASVAPRGIKREIVRRAFLGVGLDETEVGPRISQVMPRSAAAAAGLTVDDIIVAIDGRNATSRRTVVDTIARLKPGQAVKLTIQRGDEQLNVPAKLRRFPTGRGESLNELGGPLSYRRNGFPSVLQHDTVLRPNDCGGPLVDLDGLAVGINIARAGRVESFALPSDVILPLLEDLKAGKYRPRDN